MTRTPIFTAALAGRALVGPTVAGMLLVGLGACVSDANPMRDAAAAAGIGPKPVAAPDFVARSRSTELDYLPVGVSAPAREDRAKSASSVKALEADLEQARARNEARGGVRPTPAR